MKHLLIILSILLLSSPVFGQETGVLFSRGVNGKWEWFKKSNGNVLEGKYLGEIHNGKPYGQGTLTHPNGTKYVGEFKDGLENGQGTYTWTNGRKYVGEWKDGKTHGQGTMNFPNGLKYEGEFKDGKGNGQGTLTWSDGKKYVGEWKKGKPWNTRLYDKDGNITKKVVNGEWIKP